MSVMSDWVLLGLIAALVVLLLLTVFGFVVYSGLFTEVVVSAGSPPVGNITLAYKFRVGAYGESGQLFTDGCSISSKLCSIGIYYDNPHTVRCAWWGRQTLEVSTQVPGSGCFLAVFQALAAHPP